MHNVTPISYLGFYVIGIDIETEIHFSMSVHTSHWKMNSISCTNKILTINDNIELQYLV